MADANGPYFEGQRPEPCGHYYPDVIRVCDVRTVGGTFHRVTYCFKCRKSRHDAIDLSTYSNVPGSTRREFAKFRKREIERLTKGGRWEMKCGRCGNVGPCPQCDPEKFERMGADDLYRKATQKLIGVALTVKALNTDEWMRYFVESVNEWAATVGEEDRVQLTRHGGVRVLKGGA